MSLLIETRNRVRTLTLNRPDALNAFDEALYDATARALIDADSDPDVAVVILTGTGRAFTAGTDLKEMAQRVSGDPNFVAGKHGFPGLIDALVAFRKPFICAVNGLGLGLGTTILGFADVAFISTAARFKCPFTSLGLAPEAASSYLLPRLIGRQNAAWVLMSSEWISAEQAVEIGLGVALCSPEDLLTTATEHAEKLARQPISSLIAVKRTIMAPIRAQIDAARERETGAFAELMGGPANAEALAAFAEGRSPNFTDLPPGW